MFPGPYGNINPLNSCIEDPQVSHTARPKCQRHVAIYWKLLLSPRRAGCLFLTAKGNLVPLTTHFVHVPLFLVATRKNGFQDIKVVQRPYECNVSMDLDWLANMLWSFVGDTTTVGWQRTDEEKWDEAIDVLKGELQKEKGFKMLDERGFRIELVGNVVVATK